MQMQPLAQTTPRAVAQTLVEEQFESVVDVFVPAVLGKYDPATDSHPIITPEQVILADVAARVQPTRAPQSVDANGQWQSQRAVRVQLSLDNQANIRKGMVVRVKTAPKFPRLADFTYQIITAINSDHALNWTLECSTEMAG